MVIGRYDALKGITLLGDGHGNFKTVPLQQSGFVVDNDARALARIDTKNNQSLFVASIIMDSLKIFKSNKLDGLKRIYPCKDEVAVILGLGENKKRKIELNNTSGYLSASSRSVIITPGIKYAEFYNNNGHKTRVVNF